MDGQSRINEHGQPIGLQLDNWEARPLPPGTASAGRFCRIEPLDPDRHAKALFDANCLDKAGANWTYLGYGPFETLIDYQDWMKSVCAKNDPMFHAIVDLSTDLAVGVASLMRIDPANGCIEVGHINYSPNLQRHPAATEAMYLFMCRVFDELGYRRYEWKCDSLNGPSRAAANRLGFTFEGIFRQAVVYRERNRDTAWFSIVDHEWPAINRAFKGWLDSANFDSEGRQHESLSAFMSRERPGV